MSNIITSPARSQAPNLRALSGGGSVANGSIDVVINFGRPANENVYVVGQFSIFSKTPAATLYSPACLQYRNYLLDKINQSQDSTGVSTYMGEDYASVSTTSTALPAGTSRQVTIFTADRKLLTYNFEAASVPSGGSSSSGSSGGSSSSGVGSGLPRGDLQAPSGSLAKLSGDQAFLNYKLKMLDAGGNETTSNPVYYDMYMGNGYCVRYSSTTGKTVSYRTPYGRTLTPGAPSVGLEALYDEAGSIRQVWSLADGLADVVMTSPGVSYEIRIYSPSNAGTKSGKYYVPTGTPHTVWRIENPTPGQCDSVKVIKTVNGNSEVYLYTYSYTAEDWILVFTDNQVVSSKTSSWDYSRTIRTGVTVKKTASGQIASKSTSTYQTYAFGDRLVMEIEDPDGANLRTAYTYYTDAGQPGSYTRIATMSYPDGSWENYQYDSNGRKSLVVTPWKNSPMNSPAGSAKATYYSYVPLDSRDTLTPDDERPRTTEEKILGVTVNKTYNAYYIDNGQYVEVEERCPSAASAYGDSSNLRTEKRYYAAGDCTSATAGRLYRETFPDGTIKTYTYEYGNWTANVDPAQSAFTSGSGSVVRMSVVYGTTTQPDGIASKTVKAVTVYDERGNSVWSESQAYTGSGYARVSWNASVFDDLCRVLNDYSSNGTHSNYTWNCCSKESETLADGTQYTYAYDILHRLTSKTKIGASGQPNIVTSYTYDAANRQLSETVSAGGLSLAKSTEYNSAGQVTKQTDSKGLVTTYTYLNGVNTGFIKGTVNSATLPGGYLATIENYLDGRTLATTGNAIIAEYYDYGVNADGSKWAMIRIGRNDSARWRKTTIDMFGRIVKTERSGFGGAVVAQNFYNSKNQLIKTTTTGKADTLYVYDEVSNLIRTGLDVNENGTLDMASTDRISEQEAAFAQENSDWWWVKTGKVYALDGNDTATTAGTSKTRLTGFAGNVTAEVKNIDINGNVTDQTTAIDRNNKTVTVTSTSPASSVAAQAVSVNGLKTSERTASNLTYAFSYDALGRQSGITDPRTGQTTIAYYTSGLGKTGQIYTVTDAANNITTYDYDTVGRRGSVKNALNKYSYYAYNALGKVIRTWGDADYPVEQTFDNFGQMTQLKTYCGGTGWNVTTWPTDPGESELTAWTLDEASGLLAAKTYADNKSVNYTYSVDGKLLTRTWSRQVNSQPLVTTYGYNAATGEIISIGYSDGTTGVACTYNRLGQRQTITDAAGSRTFNYNDKLQLTSDAITGIYNKTITRSYATSGVIGRYTGMNIGTEYAVNYGYDGYGRLNSVGSGNDTFSYGYLDNSDLVQIITRPNNLTSAFSYEDHRNLVTAVENKYGTTMISAYGYINDAIGRRSSMSRMGTAFATTDALTYGYNDRSEVTSAVSNNISTYNYAFNFDNIGNRLNASTAETGSAISTSYASNSVNQYFSVTSASSTVNPSYDFDGNVLTDGTWTFTWNAENLLVKAEKTDQKLEFTYDYMCRRVEKKVYSGSSSNWTLSSDLKFVYDGFRCIEVINASNENSILQRFVWQPGVLIPDAPLCVYDTSTLYYFTDVNKNVGQLMDGSGNIVAKYEYSPFGKQTVCSGSYANANPFRFSSEYFDSETGLIYYNYRYYNPYLGRWLSRDPLGERGGRGLYVTVGNDAVNLYDQYGLIAFHYENGSLSFQYYRNYGGPGWANAQWVNDGWYDPTKTYIDPADDLDNCYKKHDICYEECRDKNTCPFARASCMSKCDYASFPCQLKALFGNNRLDGYVQAIPGALALGGQGVVRDGVNAISNAGSYVWNAISNAYTNTPNAWNNTAANPASNAAMLYY